jgi:hypothetical protein
MRGAEPALAGSVKRMVVGSTALLGVFFISVSNSYAETTLEQS